MVRSPSFGRAKSDEGGTRSTDRFEDRLTGRLGAQSMSENLFDLSGQVALVTGASRGLGQYFARALARAGANLILTRRKQADLTPFVSEIEALGRKVLPLELDVRDYGSIGRMAAAAEQTWGQVHIVVNNH